MHLLYFEDKWNVQYNNHIKQIACFKFHKRKKITNLKSNQFRIKQFLISMKINYYYHNLCILKGYFYKKLIE